MLDLNAILNVSDLNLNSSLTIDETTANEQNDIDLNFMSLITELTSEPDKTSLEIETISQQTEPEVLSQFFEELPALEDDGSELQEDELVALDNIENNVLAWINFPDFQPPTAIELNKAELVGKNRQFSFDEMVESEGKNPEIIANIQTNNLETELSEIEPLDVTMPIFEELTQVTKAELGQLIKHAPIAGNDFIETRDPDNQAIAINSQVDIRKPNDPAALAKPTITLATHVEAAEWGEHFNQQIVWMGQQNLKSATIKLHPQELGPLEININMSKNTTSLHIVSHSPQIRELISQALPDLRNMMAEQGVNLAEVNVDSQSNARQSNQNRVPEEFESKAYSEPDLEATEVIKERVVLGLVDYFA